MEPLTRSILDLWRALASEPTMGHLLEAVVRASEVATGAARGEIRLTDDSWSRLEFQFAQPEELAMLTSLRDRLGRRIIGLITRDSARLLLEETAPATNGPGLSGVTGDPGRLTLPMSVEGRPLGFLTLYDKPDGFSGEDREFLVSFLGQVTTAIERELMRVRLARAETRLQGVFDAIADGLLVCDRHKRPILANRAFRHMFFPPGAPNQALPAVLPPLLDHPEDTGLQEVVLLKPHARVLSSSFVRTRAPDGEVQEMILSLRDTTQSKRLDQRFLQLVTMLVRRAERLLIAWGRTRRPARRRRLMTVLRGLTRNLVRLTELKAGPLRVDKLPLTPREWFDEARPHLEKRLRRTRLALRWPEFPASADGMVFADGVMLAGALRMLARVLAGGLRPGSAVALTATEERLHLQFSFQSAREAWKQVPDPAELDWQTCVDRFLAEERKRFSLALAFIRHIMEAHKGSFSCTSGEELVVFTLALPKGGP